MKIKPQYFGLEEDPSSVRQSLKQRAPKQWQVLTAWLVWIALLGQSLGLAAPTLAFGVAPKLGAGDEDRPSQDEFCGTQAYVDQLTARENGKLSTPAKGTIGIDVLDHVIWCSSKIEQATFDVPDIIAVGHRLGGKGRDKILTELLRRAALSRMLGLSYSLSVIRGNTSLLEAGWDLKNFPGLEKKRLAYLEKYQQIAQTKNGLALERAQSLQSLLDAAVSLNSMQQASYTLSVERSSELKKNSPEATINKIDEEIVRLEASINHLFRADPLFHFLAWSKDGPDPKHLKGSYPEEAAFGRFQANPIYTAVAEEWAKETNELSEKADKLAQQKEQLAKSKKIEVNQSQLQEAVGEDLRRQPQFQRTKALLKKLISPWIVYSVQLMELKRKEIAELDRAVLNYHTELRLDVARMIDGDGVKERLGRRNPHLLKDLTDGLPDLFISQAGLGDVLDGLSAAGFLLSTNTASAVAATSWSVYTMTQRWLEAEANRHRVSTGALLGFNSFSDARDIHTQAKSRTSSNILYAFEGGLLLAGLSFLPQRKMLTEAVMSRFAASAEKSGTFAAKIKNAYSSFRSLPTIEKIFGKAGPLTPEEQALDVVLGTKESKYLSAWKRVRYAFHSMMGDSEIRIASKLADLKSLEGRILMRERIKATLEFEKTHPIASRFEYLAGPLNRNRQKLFNSLVFTFVSLFFYTSDQMSRRDMGLSELMKDNRFLQVVIEEAIVEALIGFTAMQPSGRALFVNFGVTYLATVAAQLALGRKLNPDRWFLEGAYIATVASLRAAVLVRVDQAIFRSIAKSGAISTKWKDRYFNSGWGTLKGVTKLSTQSVNQLLGSKIYGSIAKEVELSPYEEVFQDQEKLHMALSAQSFTVEENVRLVNEFLERYQLPANSSDLKNAASVTQSNDDR